MGCGERGKNMMISMKVSSKMISMKVSSKMISMKVSSKTIRNKAMESMLGAMEIFIKDSIALISGMEREKCIGLMVLSTKENG